MRNIPACAGKTIAKRRLGAGFGEHPRVRGENEFLGRPRKRWQGTSPRARGKPLNILAPMFGPGNIPACAGKTIFPLVGRGLSREHPRVRGENVRGSVILVQPEGTSPRARGKPAWVVSSFFSSLEHPRVRGENLGECAVDYGGLGTSPRARGKRRGFGRSSGVFRNIPACAGKTPINRDARPCSQEHPRVRGENADRGRHTHRMQGTSPRARGKLYQAFC